MNIKNILLNLLLLVILILFFKLIGGIIVFGLLQLFSYLKNKKINNLLKGNILFKGSIFGGIEELKHDERNKNLIMEKVINEGELGKSIIQGYPIDDFNIVFKDESFFIYRRYVSFLHSLLRTIMPLPGWSFLEIKYRDIVDYCMTKKEHLTLKVFIETQKMDSLLILHIISTEKIERDHDIKGVNMEKVSEEQIIDLIKIIEEKTNLKISQTEFKEPFTEKEENNNAETFKKNPEKNRQIKFDKKISLISLLIILPLLIIALNILLKNNFKKDKFVKLNSKVVDFKFEKAKQMVLLEFDPKKIESDIIPSIFENLCSLDSNRNSEINCWNYISDNNDEYYQFLKDNANGYKIEIVSGEKFEGLRNNNCTEEKYETKYLNFIKINCQNNISCFYTPKYMYGLNYNDETDFVPNNDLVKFSEIITNGNDANGCRLFDEIDIFAIDINKTNEEENIESVDLNHRDIDKDFFLELDKEVSKIANGIYKFEGKSTNILQSDNDVEKESYDFFWKTEEGLVVSTYLEGSDYSEFNFFNNHKIIKEFFTDEEKEEYNLLYSQDEKIKDVFKKYGFSFNNLNSTDSYNCGDKSIAFEKDDLKCLLLMRPSMEGDNSGYERTMISIKCSNGINQAIENQREVLKQLDFEDSYIHNTYSVDNLKICKEISIGIGGLGGCGGHAASFKGLDNEWIKIREGQAVPSCKDMQENNIPQKFINSCNIPCYPEEGEVVNYKDYLKKNL